MASEDLISAVHVPTPSPCRWVCAVSKVTAGCIPVSGIETEERLSTTAQSCHQAGHLHPESGLYSLSLPLADSTFPLEFLLRFSQRAESYPSVLPISSVAQASSLLPSSHCRHVNRTSPFWNCTSTLSQRLHTYLFVTCVPDSPSVL